MKKLTVCFLAMAFLFVSGTTFAQDFFADHYVGLSLGGAINTDWNAKRTGMEMDATSKVGFAVSGAFGTKLANHKNFRPELAIGFHSSKLNEVKNIKPAAAAAFIEKKLDGATKSFNCMANAYYDIPVNSQFIPFVMAGIGMSRNNFDITIKLKDGTKQAAKDNWTSFAFQVGGGVGIAINKQLSVDLAAKYFKATGDKTVQKITYTPGATINATAGIRYTF